MNAPFPHERQKLRLLIAAPRGFCAGVDRAIDIVERAIAHYGAPVYVRHEIVHNRYVVDNLRAQGAVFVEELDEVPDGAPVIFSGELRFGYDSFTFHLSQVSARGLPLRFFENDHIALDIDEPKDLERFLANELAAGESARLARSLLADVEAPALDDAADKLRAAGGEVVSCVTDVSNGADVDRLAEVARQEFGTVHVLCNNAGVGAGGLVADLTTADWEWVLGVNLWGVIHGLRAFLPGMLASGEAGHVVNTASLAGHVSAPFMAPYSASKFAVVATSEALYHELEFFSLLSGGEGGPKVEATGADFAAVASTGELGELLASLGDTPAAVHAVWEPPSFVNGALAGVAIATEAQRARYVPIAGEGGLGEGAIALLEPWLEDASRPKVLHDMRDQWTLFARYGIELPPIPDTPYFRIVPTGGPVDLRLMAELAGVDTEELHALNPAWNRWITDPEGPNRVLVPEVVADGDTGFVVAPEDEDGLANRTATLIADPDLRRLMAARARRHVEGAYSLSRLPARLGEIYAAALS